MQRTSRRNRKRSARRSRSTTPNTEQRGLSSYQHRAKSVGGADALQQYMERGARPSPVDRSGRYTVSRHVPTQQLRKSFDTAYSQLKEYQEQVTPKETRLPVFVDTPPTYVPTATMQAHKMLYPEEPPITGMGRHPVATEPAGFDEPPMPGAKPRIVEEGMPWNIFRGQSSEDAESSPVKKEPTVKVERKGTPVTINLDSDPVDLISEDPTRSSVDVNYAHQREYEDRGGSRSSLDIKQAYEMEREDRRSRSSIDIEDAYEMEREDLQEQAQRAKRSGFLPPGTIPQAQEEFPEAKDEGPPELEEATTSPSRSSINVQDALNREAEDEWQAQRGDRDESYDDISAGEAERRDREGKARQKARAQMERARKTGLLPRGTIDWEQEKGRDFERADVQDVWEVAQEAQPDAATVGKMALTGGKMVVGSAKLLGRGVARGAKNVGGLLSKIAGGVGATAQGVTRYVKGVKEALTPKDTAERPHLLNMSEAEIIEARKEQKRAPSPKPEKPKPPAPKGTKKDKATAAEVQSIKKGVEAMKRMLQQQTPAKPARKPRLPSVPERGAPRPRADTREMNAMKKQLAEMQRKMNVPDPDRMRPGTVETIPSQDMSKGDLPEYSGARQGTFEQGTPNVTESRIHRPTPIRPFPNTPARPDIRPGITEEAAPPTPPSNPASAKNTPDAANWRVTEQMGPNATVPIREVLLQPDRIASQIGWLMDNPGQQRQMAHRNLRALTAQYTRLGGNLNDLRGKFESGGARPEQTRPQNVTLQTPPPDAGEWVKETAERRRLRQDAPADLLQQLRQFATTGQRPAVAQAQAQPVMMAQPPRVVTQTQTIPIPIPMGGGSQQQQAQRPTGQSGMVVKQSVKQMQNAEAKTKRRIRKRQQSTVGKARKQYNSIKKKVKSELTKAKKAFYDAENKKIMQMKRGTRKSARTKLRAAIKAKLDKLMSRVKPGADLKTVEAINRAIAQLKKIKW